MPPVKVLVQILPGASGLELPQYMTPDAAGLDLQAALEKSLTILPGQRALIPTGFCMAIPRGYEGQVRSRSGLAVKQGLAVINAPGTIDADYRGEIKVALINMGQEPVVLERGQRIAQLIIAPVSRAELQVVAELPGSQRADGGFGHTGQ